MRVLYLCDFNLSGHSGKERATRQKLRALSRHVQQLDVVSAHDKINTLLNVVILDFRVFYLLYKKRPDVFVSRGYAGFLSLMLCKTLRIKSVREIHADAKDEVQYLDKPNLEKITLYAASYLSHFLNNFSDKRIFNHPQLKLWYESEYNCKGDNYFVYNGFSVDELVDYEKDSCRKQFGLCDNNVYIAFTGSGSYWHGIDYLVDLQYELSRIRSKVKIICGGGRVSRKIDPSSVLRNITPLDDTGCAKLICASDACILPVKDVRVSPGSPLKLYDYISHKKPVITQNDLQGYSDEVERYGYGLLVDFTNPKETARRVNDFIDSLVPQEPDVTKFSWDSRMREWVKICGDTEAVFS